MPSDGRNVVPVNNYNPNSYTGVAMDGYLKNAFVWLDINGDKKVTYCKRNADGSKADATCADEPWAMTSDHGKFTLNLTDIQAIYKANQKTQLNPRDYPLMLLAIPGQTIDEDMVAGGNPNLGIIQKAYFLMAPAGENIITPFSTLVKIERDREVSNASTTTTTTTTSKDQSVVIMEQTNKAVNAVVNRLGRTINITEDYILLAKNKAHAYAKAIVRQIQSLVPDSYSTQLQKTTVDNLAMGKDNPFLLDSVMVIGRATLNSIKPTVDAVDAAVNNTSDDSLYKLVNVSGLTLPTLSAVLDNPLVLTKKTLTESSSTVLDERLLVVSSSGNLVTGQFTYTYSANGNVIQEDVDGISNPFLRSLDQTTKVNNNIDQSTILNYDKNNLLTSEDVKHFSYDANGTQTTKLETKLTYTYNSANKITSIETDLLDGTKISKKLFSYSTQNVGDYSTETYSFTNGVWVKDANSLETYNMEDVPGGKTGEKRIKQIFLSYKYVKETAPINYRIDYCYYAQNDATYPNLLKKRLLVDATLVGSACTNSSPTPIYAIENYEYAKHLADIVFK
jgi:hypothetical protein